MAMAKMWMASLKATVTQLETGPYSKDPSSKLDLLEQLDQLPDPRKRPGRRGPAVTPF
jgi:hypothetical protein